MTTPLPAIHACADCGKDSSDVTYRLEPVAEISGKPEHWLWLCQFCTALRLKLKDCTR